VLVLLFKFAVSAALSCGTFLVCCRSTTRPQTPQSRGTLWLVSCKATWLCCNKPTQRFSSAEVRPLCECWARRRCCRAHAGGPHPTSAVGAQRAVNSLPIGVRQAAARVPVVCLAAWAHSCHLLHDVGICSCFVPPFAEAASTFSQLESRSTGLSPSTRPSPLPNGGIGKAPPPGKLDALMRQLCVCLPRW
jgi:hypothetical protein